MSKMSTKNMIIKFQVTGKGNRFWKNWIEQYKKNCLEQGQSIEGIEYKSDDENGSNINIADPTDDVKNLVNPDEPVLSTTSANTYIIEIDYPLSTPYITNIILSMDQVQIDEFNAKNLKNSLVIKQSQITRKEIILLICQLYQEIYASKKYRKKYGIWGHGIGDLVLTSISVSPNNYITLGVDS